MNYSRISYYLNIFFYHFFIIDEWCKKNIKKCSFPSVNIDGLLKQNILIPSLQTQKEIVDILDKFNAITNDISEGLPKEIEQKQYEYYREKLLSF